MPTRNINLTEHDDEFVEQQIGAGKSRNASEVLRKLAAEGFGELDQGKGLTIPSEDELHRVMAQIGCQAAKANTQHQAE